MRSSGSQPPRTRVLCLIALWSLVCLGLAPAQGQEGAAPSGPADPDAPPWAHLIETLRTGTLPEKGQIVDRLLGVGDAAVLVPLKEALGEEDRALRVRITTGVLRTFPKEAPDFFFSLFGDENLHRREAGAFAIGALDDPRVLPTLLPLLEDPNPTISEAAARSILQRGKQSANAAYAHAIGSKHPQAENLRRLYRETAAAVSQYALEHSAHSTLGRMLFRRFADRAGAKSLRARAAAAAPDDAGMQAVAELGARVAHWSPRAELPDNGVLSYTMIIENVFVGSNKIVEIEVESTDFKTLQFWGYSLDRAVRCDLPIDTLLLDPSVCAPKLIESTEGPRVIEYRLPERTNLQAGIGILNIAFWSASIGDGRRVRLELDREMGLPVREQVFSDAGTLVFEVEYGKYEEVRASERAPMTMNVRVPAAPISGKAVPLRHEFRFRTTDGVWHFDGGETYAWETPEGDTGADGSEVLRAVGFVKEPKWTPTPPPPPKEPAEGERPKGESSKSSPQSPSPNSGAGG